MDAVSFGMPELLIILALGVFWVLPVAASLWALLTLHRIRTGQQAIGVQLESIVRILQASRQAG